MSSMGLNFGSVSKSLYYSGNCQKTAEVRLFPTHTEGEVGNDPVAAGGRMKRPQGFVGEFKRDSRVLPGLAEAMCTHPTVIGPISAHSHTVTIEKKIEESTAQKLS